MEDTKYMNSKIQKVSIDEWIKLFKSAVRESDNNLDQFVEGSMVRIPEKTSETFVDILNQFITSARDVVFTCENVEKIWDDIKKIGEDGENKKFIDWLIKYVEVGLKPRKDAEPIVCMDADVFKNMSLYVFRNYVLKNVGKGNIDEQWDSKQVFIMKKMMHTLIEMLLVDCLSEDYAIGQMQNLFGMNIKQCKLWVECINDDRETLWKMVLMKKISSIEHRIGNLEDILKDERF